MSKFIELTNYHSGKKVLFNINSIETVCEEEEHLTICTPEGDYYYFAETYEEVKMMIKNEQNTIANAILEIDQTLYYRLR